MVRRIESVTAIGSGLNVRRDGSWVGAGATAAFPAFPNWDQQAWREAFEALVLTAPAGAPSLTELTAGIATGYHGGVFAPNGQLYVTPSDATQAAKFDPTTGAGTLLGAVGSGSLKWQSAVLAPGGIVYGIPYDGALGVLRIDTNDDSMTVLGVPVAGVGGTGGAWQGACLAPNGLIYCAPRNASRVLVIDPSNDSYSYVDVGTAVGGSKWIGCYVGKSGRIYFVPRQHPSFLVLDPTDNSFDFVGNDARVGKWQTAVMSLDGHLYCAPRNVNSVAKMDTVNDTYVEIATADYSAHGGARWYGGGILGDGRIVFNANSASAYMMVDPADDTVSLFGTHPLNVTTHASAVPGPDGAVYLVPGSQTTTLGKITAPGTRPLGFPGVLSPFTNVY